MVTHGQSTKISFLKSIFDRKSVEESVWKAKRKNKVFTGKISKVKDKGLQETETIAMFT